MKPATIYLLLLVTLLFGCNESPEPPADESRADDVASTVTVKIAVFKDGKVEIGGTELSLEDATARIQAASGTRLQVRCI